MIYIYIYIYIFMQVMPQISCTYKFSDEDNSDIEPDKISLRTNNREERSFECNVSSSGSSEDITLSESGSSVETESDFDIRSGTHKGIIIQKDSEIIVLKNELCVNSVVTSISNLFLLYQSRYYNYISIKGKRRGNGGVTRCE